MKRFALALTTAAALAAGVLMVAPASAMAATTTLSCTAGSGITANSMTVYKSYRSGIFDYQVSRSNNRTVNVGGGSSGVREITHKATKLVMYSPAATTTIFNPGDPHHFKSTTGGNSIRIYFRSTDGATMDVTQSCLVNYP